MITMLTRKRVYYLEEEAIAVWLNLCVRDVFNSMGLDT